MIVILHQNDSQTIAESMRLALIEAFNHIAIRLVSVEEEASWEAVSTGFDASRQETFLSERRDFEEEVVSWDDLLLILFNNNHFPEAGNQFIENYIHQRSGSAKILPVTLDAASPIPPGMASAIKALPYKNSTADLQHLVNRAGAMLYLKLQGRDSKIFISYRASDGKKIAKQLFAHLAALGHTPFLDEAPETDGDTKILPGTPVQQQIDQALGNANLVLLIDTRDAPASGWIKHEIETADGLLLPVLPLCFREATDNRKGPRFQSLVALQRWVSLLTPISTEESPLTADQLDKIVQEAETYLCEIFQRKCRVPSIVKQEFITHGYVWEELDKKLLMFKSSKTHNPRLTSRIHSHCSIFDQIYPPALLRFNSFLQTNVTTSNYSLFIYDGELLSDTQLQEFIKAEDQIIILHHQELAALIDSNFTFLGAA